MSPWLSTLSHLLLLLVAVLIHYPSMLLFSKASEGVKNYFFQSSCDTNTVVLASSFGSIRETETVPIVLCASIICMLHCNIIVLDGIVLALRWNVIPGWQHGKLMSTRYSFWGINLNSLLLRYRYTKVNLDGDSEPAYNFCAHPIVDEHIIESPVGVRSQKLENFN